MIKTFINGCFDLIHPGHVELITFAASLGKLDIGLNTDESMRRIKREPFFDQTQRLYMLSCFRAVHRIHYIHHDTPIELLTELYEKDEGPDLVIKGLEYAGAQIPETSVIQNHGGSIIYYDSQFTLHTTDIINRIKKL